MYNICFPVYNPATFNLAVGLIKSAYAGSLKPDNIIVVDNSLGLFEPYYKQELAVNNIPYMDITIVNLGKNVGLTGAMNYALRILDDYIFLLGDDCVFHHTTAEDIITAAKNNDYGMIFYPANVTDPQDKTMSPFSFFLQKKELVNFVGYYDELYPVYYADNIMFRRMSLVGLDMNRAIVPVNTSAGHWGSAHVKAAKGIYKRTHDKYWYFNSELYVAQWGGTPGNEKYTVEFNGGNKESIIERLKAKHGITN